MTDRTYLGNPEQTAQGGRDISSAGERLSGSVARHSARIKGITAGKPWGGDDTGQAFEKNYVPAEEEYFPAAKQVGELVTGVGKGVEQAVRQLTGTDEGNAQNLNGLT